jgi:hypothetical protein
MGKIVCSTCVNERSGKCIIKKATVALNKRRRCESYILEPNKVKDKQILKTVRLSYTDQQKLRDELKELRRLEKYEAKSGNSTDPKHPLTGDLSRFTSTATKNNNG